MKCKYQLETKKSSSKGWPIIRSLVTSSFKGQYRHSFFGVLWQFITPVVLVILYYVVFTSIRDTTNKDYWLQLCTGIFPYIFMESGIISAGFCFIHNSSLVKKLYFPRQYLVYAHVISYLITFIISLTFVIIFAVFTGHYVSISGYFLIIIYVILTTVFTLGLALFISATVVYIRDLGHIISACSRLLFWAAPTIYTIYEVTGLLKVILTLNPMSYFITGFQKIILFGVNPGAWDIFLCTVISLTMLFIGTVVFNLLKNGIAERV